MTDDKWAADERQRLLLAERVLAEQPQSVRNEYREQIRCGTVVLGMTPFEAKLAGGAFKYKVKFDETVWPANSDPMAVMWAQTERPDASFIQMTFRNLTQFPADAATTFSVFFEEGKAKQIKREGV